MAVAQVARAARRRGGAESGLARPRRPTLSRTARRRAVVSALVLLGIAGAVWFGRDLPLWRVKHVTVLGLQGPGAAQARQALIQAAEQMTTLAVDHRRLRAALAGYPLAAGVEVDRRLPDGLVLRVRLRRPVAVIVGPRGRLAVADDGTALPGVRTSDALPTLQVPDGPEPRRPPSRSLARRLQVLATAPPQLLPQVATVIDDRQLGLVATMRSGLRAIFGAATDLKLKWRSMSAVLAADDTVLNASYLDLRVPSRPAAGGFVGNSSPQATSTAGGPGTAQTFSGN